MKKNVYAICKKVGTIEVEIDGKKVGSCKTIDEVEDLCISAGLKPKKTNIIMKNS